MLRLILDEETGVFNMRSDALYSFGDAVMEAWVSGKGPLGPIGCFGLWFGLLVSAIARSIATVQTTQPARFS